jgi:hypothetical protein
VGGSATSWGEELTLAQIDHHADAIEKTRRTGHHGVRRTRFTATAPFFK